MKEGDPILYSVKPEAWPCLFAEPMGEVCPYVVVRELLHHDLVRIMTENNGPTFLLEEDDLLNPSIMYGFLFYCHGNERVFTSLSYVRVPMCFVKGGRLNFFTSLNEFVDYPSIKEISIIHPRRFPFFFDCF